MNDVSLFPPAAQPGTADHLDAHPLANIFPMLSEEELDELAADIKENGLLHPIVRMTDHKTIVDGRNRYEACHRAGIEPEFDDYIENDEQARALIVSANLQRRNMTKGQQAMALAMIYPEPKRGMHSEFRNGTGEVSKARLSSARAVLRAAPDDLAPSVLAGSMSIDAALAEIEKRLHEANSDTAKLARLREEAPDLAELVVEERMKLSEAVAALDHRIAEAQRVEASKRDTIYRTAEAAYSGTMAWSVDAFVEGVKQRIQDQDFRATLIARLRIDPEVDPIKQIRAGANALAEILRLLENNP